MPVDLTGRCNKTHACQINSITACQPDSPASSSYLASTSPTWIEMNSWARRGKAGTRTGTIITRRSLNYHLGTRVTLFWTLEYRQNHDTKYRVTLQRSDDTVAVLKLEGEYYHDCVGR